jgi:hypothetical protein
MSLEGLEMHLRDWINAVWFKGLARISVIILLPLVGGVTGFLIALNVDVNNVEAAQIAVTETVGELSADMTAVKTGVDGLQTDVRGMTRELDTMSGILSEMQRRSLATASYQ